MANAGISGARSLVACVFLLLLMASHTRASLSNAQRQESLDAHNIFRRREVTNQGATGLRLIEWDKKLENFAANYITKCEFAHSKSADRNKAGRGNGERVGENLFYTSEATYNVTKAIGLWYEEIVDYTFATRMCAAGKQCGHYTQMVWNITFRVGCASRRCPSSSLLMCNYAPAGNIRPYGEQYPRQPYIKGGEPCSNCPSDAPGCVKNLCARAGVTSDPKVPKNLATPQPKGRFLASGLCCIWVATFMRSVFLRK